MTGEKRTPRASPYLASRDARGGSCRFPVGKSRGVSTRHRSMAVIGQTLEAGDFPPSFAPSSPADRGRLLLASGPRQTRSCPRPFKWLRPGCPRAGRGILTLQPPHQAEEQPQFPCINVRAPHYFSLSRQNKQAIPAFPPGRWAMLSCPISPPHGPQSIPARGHPARSSANPKPADDPGCSSAPRTAAGEAPSAPALAFPCRNPTSSPSSLGNPARLPGPQTLPKNRSRCQQATTSPSLSPSRLSVHPPLAKAGQGAQREPLLARRSCRGSAGAPGAALPPLRRSRGSPVGSAPAVGGCAGSRPSHPLLRGAELAPRCHHGGRWARSGAHRSPPGSCPGR